MDGYIYIVIYVHINIGILCLGYLMIIIFIEYFILCDNMDVVNTKPTGYERHTCFWKGNFRLTMDDLFQFSAAGFLTSFPIFVFAYSCQPNLLPIYVELQRPTVPRMHKVIRRSLYFSVTMYLIVAIFGYLTFMDKTCGNILINNFKQHPQVIIGAIGIAISCQFTLINCVYAFRENFTVFFFDKVQVKTIPHIIITFIVIACACGIAITVSNLATVLGFLGSTTNPSVAYFLPNIFFIKLVPKGLAFKRKIIALLMTIILIGLSFASFIFQIFAIFDDNLNPGSTCDDAQQIQS